MAYVEAAGYLDGGGDAVFTVRWQDGDWSGDESLIDRIKRAKQRAGPTVALTPTGPYEPVDTPRAAAFLAGDVFDQIVTFKTDIPIKRSPTPKGTVF